MYLSKQIMSVFTILLAMSIGAQAKCSIFGPGRPGFSGANGGSCTDPGLKNCGRIADISHRHRIKAGSPQAEKSAGAVGKSFGRPESPSR
ncbi:hypothetical protein Cob_v011407 [Colletotrichum orbiculare MAFF 240422]|uniref:Uncharacterized protein n=1 Tax=Colletotrichum orbiculare (strain 104-T / ATCC 96160 / CBS 514.97 / LARS 414 / MAFF 240422) TaxID=1213857 RepID=A0A484FBM1_COLOR|nr:hypothetical protein Cob_v011407 [Colletotrichum orbiculare MAFF 240422]